MNKFFTSFFDNIATSIVNKEIESVAKTFNGVVVRLKEITSKVDERSEGDWSDDGIKLLEMIACDKDIRKKVRKLAPKLKFLVDKLQELDPKEGISKAIKDAFDKETIHEEVERLRNEVKELRSRRPNEGFSH